MSSDDDLTALVTDLVTTLQDLETEIEPTTESGLPRPPTPRELLRFTSDVTIPAIILVLKTNVEALKLLRRALRMAEGRPTASGSASGEVRQRATRLSRATLARLDDALTDLQRAVEGTPEDEEARELLDEAQELRAELAERLADAPETDDAGADAAATDVPVDVDAELQSIKEDVDGEEGGNAGEESGDGTDES
ncbi:DUF7547 family protein [Haloarcula salina]|uniref:Uncharacterized protein n=1 Tax=Haloarcula salina TaxID=1429914 RepID=A0AA41G431_9EURY|nr:hypothetical protein [Haloarcula salina]MBV0903089.1 hypothetical protein [Haloarcula salina]